MSDQSESPWICFSAQDWWYHNRAHSDFQLMRRIARVRPVLFINSIGMRMPLPGRSTQPGRRVLRKAKSMLQFLRRPLEDTPNFYVYTPFVLPFYDSPRMRSMSALLVRQQIRAVAGRLGMHLPHSIVFLTIPTALEVVRGQQFKALLYNRSDLHSAFKETNQDYIRDLERELLSTCDAVLYASHALMDSERLLTGSRSRFLDHGVDFDRFARDVGPVPRDLSVIPRPRVGFFGGIDDYVVDLDLIEHAARALPNVAFVLIGDATCSMSRFEVLPNVHWLGFRPHEQIPAYGAGFDVAVMPWLCNDWIKHSNPIKLKEYLALGVPVVSMDFPEVQHYADVIAVASDYDEFVHLIQSALGGQAVGSEATRRRRVAESTWDLQSERLLEIGQAASDRCAALRE